MEITQILRSPQAKQLSAISMLVEAGLALRRGNEKIAAMLAGAAFVAYQWSGVGFAIELLIRFYQWAR